MRSPGQFCPGLLIFKLGIYCGKGVDPDNECRMAVRLVRSMTLSNPPQHSGPLGKRAVGTLEEVVGLSAVYV